MNRVRRVVCLVADGFGVGELPDAKHYGDEGSNTLAHTCHAVGGLSLPYLQKLGLGNLGSFEGLPPNSNPLGFTGKMQEKSAGKDTTTGHWEISGIVTTVPQATFPQGFPTELLQQFISASGIEGVLGNKAASGTEIITELGETSVISRQPIVYTSADSVFQIAAHEESFGLERLYKICRIARDLTRPLNIGRVIARPFSGTHRADFRRTENRRDFSLAPGRNCLDLISESGVPVYSVGKIEDIFDHRGITAGNHTGNNLDSLRASLDFLQKSRGKSAFVFTNLVDFDMLYGHRRDPRGYAGALAQLDDFLPKIISELEPEDVLILTSDHGCDPTFKGTDHTREYVPLLVYSPGIRGGDLGRRESFADVASTLIEGYGVAGTGAATETIGKSFLCELQN